VFEIDILVLEEIELPLEEPSAHSVLPSMNHGKQ
jgi:hypothetical protein